jgi:hypothetical protein
MPPHPHSTSKTRVASYSGGSRARSWGQRQNGHNIRKAPCEKSGDQVDPAEGANTGCLAPLSGNLCGAVSDWWSNEDSNQGPGQFYRRRAIGAIVVEAARPRAVILLLSAM